jgi:hypothetical protein
LNYEKIKFNGQIYLRAPAVKRGWCIGCVNEGFKLSHGFCGELDSQTAKGCIMAIIIEDTPEAIELYETKRVIARLEGEE